jgi:hypothetical protein
LRIGLLARRCGPWLRRGVREVVDDGRDEGCHVLGGNDIGLCARKLHRAHRYRQLDLLEAVGRQHGDAAAV